MRKPNICSNFMYIYYITAKIIIFCTDMLWESCSKSNLEQLSHSMFCKNIARLASIQGTPVSIATAKRVIFLQSILRESCFKLNSKQISHSMFCKNNARLAVAMETTEHTMRKLFQI